MADPRRTPARPDLAAAALEGRVSAPRYVAGRKMQVLAPQLPLRRTPSPESALDTEALHGETLTVFDVADGWAWGQLDRDRYVGYLPLAGLAEPAAPTTHRVAAVRTFAYPGPSIKSPIVMGLSLGAEVAVAEWTPPFARTGDGTFLWAAHLAPKNAAEPDFVAVAERLLDTPYLWGGKTSFGLDCSGLVQVSLSASGVPAPRDSGMQERETGGEIPCPEDLGGLRRGDLVFWTGHVGIMRDPATLLHAAGYYMTVVSEPLALVRDRILQAGFGPITRVRRIETP